MKKLAACIICFTLFVSTTNAQDFPKELIIQTPDDTIKYADHNTLVSFVKSFSSTYKLKFEDTAASKKWGAASANKSIVVNSILENELIITKAHRFEISLSTSKFHTYRILKGTSPLDMAILESSNSPTSITLSSAVVGCDSMHFVINRSSLPSDEKPFIQYVYGTKTYVEPLTIYGTNPKYRISIPRDFSNSAEKIEYYIFTSPKSASDLQKSSSIEAEYDTTEIKLLAFSSTADQFETLSFATLSPDYLSSAPSFYCDSSYSTLSIEPKTSWPSSFKVRIIHNDGATEWDTLLSGNSSSDDPWEIKYKTHFKNPATPILKIQESTGCTTVYHNQFSVTKNNKPTLSTSFVAGDNEMCYDPFSNQNDKFKLNINTKVGASNVPANITLKFDGSTQLKSSFSSNFNGSSNATYTSKSHTNTLSVIDTLYITTSALSMGCSAKNTVQNIAIYYPEIKAPQISFSDQSLCDGDKNELEVKDNSGYVGIITNFTIEDLPPESIGGISATLTKQSGGNDKWDITGSTNRTSTEQIKVLFVSKGFDNCNSDTSEKLLNIVQHPVIKSDWNSDTILCHQAGLNIQLSSDNPSTSFTSVFTDNSPSKLSGLPYGDELKANITSSSISNSSTSNSHTFDISTEAELLGCKSKAKWNRNIRILPSNVNSTISLTSSKTEVCSQEDLVLKVSNVLDGSNNSAMEYQLKAFNNAGGNLTSNSNINDKFSSFSFADKIRNTSKTTQSARYTFTSNYKNGNVTCPYPDEGIVFDVSPELLPPKLEFSDLAMCSGQEHEIVVSNNSGITIPNLKFEYIKNTKGSGVNTLSIKAANPPATDKWTVQADMNKSFPATSTATYYFKMTGFDGCESGESSIVIKTNNLPVLEGDIDQDTFCNNAEMRLDLNSKSGTTFESTFGKFNSDSIKGIDFSSTVNGNSVGKYTLDNQSKYKTQSFEIQSVGTNLGCKSEPLITKVYVLPQLTSFIAGDSSVCSRSPFKLEFINHLDIDQNPKLKYNFQSFTDMGTPKSLTRLGSGTDDSNLSFEDSIDNSNTQSKQTAQYEFTAVYDDRCFYNTPILKNVVVKPWVRFSDPPFVEGSLKACTNSEIFYVINETQKGGSYFWSGSSDVRILQDNDIGDGLSSHILFTKEGTETITISGANDDFCSSDTSFDVVVSGTVPDFDVLKIQNIPTDILTVNLNTFDTISWGYYDKMDLLNPQILGSKFQTQKIVNFNPSANLYYAEITKDGCKSKQFYNYNGKVLSIVSTDLQILLYPNPASNSLRISSSKYIDTNQLKVFDSFGRQLNVPVRKSFGEIQIKLNGLATGTYYIQLNEGSNSSTYKFIKI